MNIEEEDSNTAIFSCPEEDCIKTFVRYSSMHRHLDFGKHQHALEQSTLLDKAAIGYAQKFEGEMPSCSQAGRRVGHSSQVPLIDVDLHTSKRSTRLRNFNKVSSQDEKVIQHQLHPL